MMSHLFIIVCEEDCGSSAKVVPETYSIEGVATTEDHAIAICREKNAPEVNELLVDMSLKAMESDEWRELFDGWNGQVYHYFSSEILVPNLV